MSITTLLVLCLILLLTHDLLCKWIDKRKP